MDNIEVLKSEKSEVNDYLRYLESMVFSFFNVNKKIPKHELMVIKGDDWYEEF